MNWLKGLMGASPPPRPRITGPLAEALDPALEGILRDFPGIERNLVGINTSSSSPSGDPLTDAFVRGSYHPETGAWVNSSPAGGADLDDNIFTLGHEVAGHHRQALGERDYLTPYWGYHRQRGYGSNPYEIDANAAGYLVHARNNPSGQQAFDVEFLRPLAARRALEESDLAPSRQVASLPPQSDLPFVPSQQMTVEPYLLEELRRGGVYYPFGERTRHGGQFRGVELPDLEELLTRPGLNRTTGYRQGWDALKRNPWGHVGIAQGATLGTSLPGVLQGYGDVHVGPERSGVPRGLFPVLALDPPRANVTDIDQTGALQEVLDRGSSANIYATPKGLHLWGQPGEAPVSAPVQDLVDPKYQLLSGGNTSKIRVGPKPWRAGDFVNEPLVQQGSRSAGEELYRELSSTLGARKRPADAIRQRVSQETDVMRDSPTREELLRRYALMLAMGVGGGSAASQMEGPSYE